jgi:hypothetical protein
MHRPPAHTAARDAEAVGAGPRIRPRVRLAAGGEHSRARSFPLWVSGGHTESQRSPNLGARSPCRRSWTSRGLAPSISTSHRRPHPRPSRAIATETAAPPPPRGSGRRRAKAQLSAESKAQASAARVVGTSCSMSLERARRAWVRAVNAHLRAAESHDVAAELFAQLRDSTLAARESELAAAERKGYAIALARHPEWAGDVRQGSGASAATTRSHF